MKLKDFFTNYYTVREQMVKAVQGLTPEQLAWNPENHKNSIARLLGHIALCERFWISTVAQGEGPFDEDRYRKARELPELLGLLNEDFKLMDSYLAREDLEGWEGVVYEFTEDGKTETFTKKWLVWHVVEHQARHRGQVFMLMTMQGIEVPDV